MKLGRRAFLGSAAAGAAPAPASRASTAAVDFRYAPLEYQTAYCFPDDPQKSLVGHAGQLLYGNPGRRGADYFPIVVDFGLRGMEPERVRRQQLEAPGVPIIHTRIERPEAIVELTTFATNSPGEGRVDNVLLTVQPRRAAALAAPRVNIQSGEAVAIERKGEVTRVLVGADRRLLMVTATPLSRRETGRGAQLTGAESQDRQWFFRFPQQGQAAETLARGLADPQDLLAQARGFWRAWRPCGGDVEWDLPGVYGEFLTACARNILQARERRGGKLTFQVGPTCYRGLWVVDGHFILEAARYLGYDREAEQGLETTWGYQRENGAVLAGAGEEHWKDTAIAMFTLVRQCELAGDWSALEAHRAHVERGVAFLDGLRERARRDGHPAARYGILARGMADGGIARSDDLTNTLWALAGLQAVAAADRGFDSAARLYAELRKAFEAAVQAETKRHPAGFAYLPMIMAEDPLWKLPHEWQRPKPQVAQWALSQAIYPGVLFAPADPVVTGHMALLRHVTREDVPVETGWIHNGGLWTYDAAFTAHVYLWAGEQEWARRTFQGFLNHASPLYCWREEQPLRGALESGYVGDMPHNWASAECVLYLRHMLALEDRRKLRLLAGIGAPELSRKQPYAIRRTPTRFGRINVELEPAARGWRLRYARADGPAPQTLELPRVLGGMRLEKVDGAALQPGAGPARVDPQAKSLTATYLPAPA